MRSPCDVSVCIVVRTTAAHLERCLSSVASIASEAIVVDTGSTPATAAITRDCGATLLRRSWNDDMAAARNHGIESARCSWVLALDADEIVDVSDGPRFCSWLRAQPPAAFVVSIQHRFRMDDTPPWLLPHQFVGEADRGIGCATTTAVRLFPRLPLVRYCHTVQESLESSLTRAGLAMRRCPLPVRHVMHESGEDMRAAADGFRRLAEKKTRLFPRQADGYGELGRILLYLGDLAGAEHALVECRRVARRWNADVCYCLGLTWLRQGRYRQSQTFLSGAVRRYPHRPELRMLLAVADLEAGDQTSAMIHLARLVERGRQAAAVGAELRRQGRPR